MKTISKSFMGALLELGCVGTPRVIQDRAPAIPSPHPSPARLMARLSTGAGASRCSKAGLLIRAHRSVSKTLRKLLASFSDATASCVKTLRKNAVSAARDGSFVLGFMRKIFAPASLSTLLN